MTKISKNKLLYIMISTIMHQSQPTNITVKNTFKLIELINKDEKNKEDYIVEYAFSNRVISHRFPNKMCYYLKSMFYTICEDYDGKIEKVFYETGNILADQKIINNLKHFKGISNHKANIALMKFKLLNCETFDYEEFSLQFSNCYTLDSTLSEEIKAVNIKY